jgi:selenide,water dikinase
VKPHNHRRALVLVGGGHSHVEVLRLLALRSPQNVDVTLISRDALTPYSGMLPGLIAGHYDSQDMHIDLAPLCAKANARLIIGQVNRVDMAAGQVFCDPEVISDAEIGFDVLSINAGSAPSLSRIDGADHIGIPVKPIGRFLPHWTALLEKIKASRNEVFELAIVGGGAGGVELAFAIQYRLTEVERIGKLRLVLIDAANELLAGHNDAVRRRMRQLLNERGIRVHTSVRVLAAKKGLLLTTAGEMSTDEVLWVTQAGSQDWFAASGLDVDTAGFIRVDEALQSTSHPGVFAAGDAASMIDHSLPKAGVFAVRQGPILAVNLLRYLDGQTPVSYQPQSQALSLISTGDRSAVASRGAFTVGGSWVWRWKDWIDRRFIDRYKI